MIHHLSLGTNDLDRARAFYDPLMQLVGLRLIKHSDRILGYGMTETVFSLEKPVDGQRASPGNGAHVAFHAGNRKIVTDFYVAGLANGGTSEGEPGLRTDYDPHYFAAFLRDPDGNKVEVVTFAGS
jgi:catechol 2,3-dioxygenase-like lactoylglutathione lyase family enzyme